MKRPPRYLAPWTDCSGYTLIELSVTMALTLLVSGLLYGAYAFSVQWSVRAQQTITLQNHAHLLMTRLVRDIQAAEFVEHRTDTTWVLHSPNDITHTYVYADSSWLLRNNILVHDSSLHVTHLAVNPVSERPLPARAGRAPLNAPKPPYFHIQLALASSRETIMLETTAGSRTLPGWPAPNND